MKIIYTFILLCVLTTHNISIAENSTHVIINGQQLSMQQLRRFQNQTGTRILPGNYLYNTHNQCWSNLSNGQSGCFGKNTSTLTPRKGSSTWDSKGNWNSWNDYDGSQTNNGCIYTTSWSNC